MFKIVFLATQWGSKHGGINSFNNDLTIAFSNLLPKEDFKITCVVTEIEHADFYEAEKHNIEIIKIENLNNTLEIFNKVHTWQDEILLWIGHDVITGFSAINTAKYYKEKTQILTKVAIFHHMDYSEYGHLKGYSAEQVNVKDKEQIKVLSEADLVLAVGPKLSESAEDKLKMGNASGKLVLDIIPGIHDEIIHNQLNKFNCISYGRFGDNDKTIKQGKLAIAAFCTFSSNAFLQNSHLTLFGIEPSQFEGIKNLRKEFGQKVENIHPFEFKSRSEIFEMLSNQSVSLMLSLREGFGLTGWEAISAGVPLILSKNSGLYMFLENVLSPQLFEAIYPVNILGDEDGEVNTSDIKSVVTQLEIIYNNRKYANKKAMDLKNFLLDKGYTWENAARKILKNCMLKESISKIEFEKDYYAGLLNYFLDLLKEESFDAEILEYYKHAGEILAKKEGKTFFVSVLNKFSYYADDEELMDNELREVGEKGKKYKADEIWLYIQGGNYSEYDLNYIQSKGSVLINDTFKLLNISDIYLMQENHTERFLNSFL